MLRMLATELLAEVDIVVFGTRSSMSARLGVALSAFAPLLANQVYTFEDTDEMMRFCKVRMRNKILFILQEDRESPPDKFYESLNRDLHHLGLISVGVLVTETIHSSIVKTGPFLITVSLQSILGRGQLTNTHSLNNLPSPELFKVQGHHRY